MLETKRNALIVAAQNADWTQVALNALSGGLPCFHLADDEHQFCLRGHFWDGHRPGQAEFPFHPYVPLHELLATLLPGEER